MKPETYILLVQSFLMAYKLFEVANVEKEQEPKEEPKEEKEGDEEEEEKDKKD